MDCSCLIVKERMGGRGGDLGRSILVGGLRMMGYALMSSAAAAV